MKYLLLLYGDPAAEAALEPDERRAIVDGHLAFRQRLEGRGQLVAGEPLAGSDGAFAVRLRDDGMRLATDGPFAETKEHLGSYYVVECKGREEAEAVARDVPASPGLVVEVWPVAEM
ncbi:MAG TPA: YciI family protein [Gaiellaceae bacterium]|nr:YciI family protein [Gaiellaceae bacterium]